MNEEKALKIIMAKKEKQPKYTFEGTLCYKDGKPYGRIVEESESHIVVELRAESKNDYPQRYEFRKVKSID